MAIIRVMRDADTGEIYIETNLKANNNLYHFFCDRILYK